LGELNPPSHDDVHSSHRHGQQGGRSSRNYGMSDSEKQQKNGPMVVLSGPSGSGKTTIVERLIRESSVPLVKSVSATTRPPRMGEVHGDSYYFLPDGEFRQKLAGDEFLEHAEVFSSGFLYGTLRAELDRAWTASGNRR